MQTRKLTCFVAATLVSSLLVLSATAHAQPQEPLVVQGRIHIDPKIQRTVSYADLNLTDESGWRALQGRVKYAVNDLCQLSTPQRTDLGSSRLSNECAAAAWNSAKPQISAALRDIGSETFAATTVIISAPVASGH